MFYYILTPILTYNYILIASAVIPALFLMVKVYNSDRLEKENPYLLQDLVKAGIFSSLLALVEERILVAILDQLVAPNTVAYNLILYFGVVAVSEESSKYIFLKRNTWNNREFNCQYDGVVYATFVSLGFALWENISYVLNYGLTTAIARAITAIPGHACFGVFMGVFYGVAKKYDFENNTFKSRCYRILALAAPMTLHGCYDYIATLQQPSSDWYFLAYIAVLFCFSYYTVIQASKKDQYI